jgi:RHS repeat-associated protein
MTNTYRADGLRHQMADQSGTEQMVWDQNDTLAWVDGTGALGQFFSRGTKAVKTYSSPTRELFYHCDAIGTMQAYSNPDGTTNERALLDAWGGDARSMGFDVCSFVGDLGYWGQVAGLSRPLYYVRARWLVSGGPGWLSRDPAAAQPLGAYGYVESCPTRLIDPTGLLLQAILGFDDSPKTGVKTPDPASTQEIMTVLLTHKPQRIRGAFFVIGQYFDVQVQHPSVDIRNTAAGDATFRNLYLQAHLLGNHTYCHAHSFWPPNGCATEEKCADVWKADLCRAHELVLRITHGYYPMSFYRTPGLDWGPQVIGPVANVLPGYRFLADAQYNTVDVALASTVLTLHDADPKKPVPWSAKVGQLDTFLKHPRTRKLKDLGTVYIIMHDQASNSKLADPTGTGLLALVIGYLQQNNIPIVNPPDTRDPGDYCVDFLSNLTAGFSLPFKACPPQT